MSTWGLVSSGSPREARQPRLAPWLDFEKKKTAAVACSQLKWHAVKGQLISKCLLGVIVSTKKPTKFL